MTRIQNIIVAALLTIVSATSYAQRSSELSADLPDSRTMAIQDKVENLFVAAKFERAFFIYRNELAPIGDKYAQYMVGYMYHKGLGVAEDTILASAWYRLSAERGTREFIAVRDRLMRTMDEDDIKNSDRQHFELRQKFCDLAVLFASVKRDMKELEVRTGTRIGSSTSPVVVIENRLGRIRSGADYYGDIRDQLETRLLLLKEVGDFREMDADPDRLNIRELERRVQQRVEFGVE